MDELERLRVIARVAELELPGGVDVGWLSDGQLLELDALPRGFPELVRRVLGRGVEHGPRAAR